MLSQQSRLTPGVETSILFYRNLKQIFELEDALLRFNKGPKIWITVTLACFTMDDLKLSYVLNPRSLPIYKHYFYLLLHREGKKTLKKFNLVFKTEGRISVALLHPKLLMIWWE
jgi:hypothetical protein